MHSPRQQTLAQQPQPLAQPHLAPVKLLQTPTSPTCLARPLPLATLPLKTLPRWLIENAALAFADAVQRVARWSL